MRTFVFITDIPDSLLEPVQVAATDARSGVPVHVKPNRDPRFEKLRRLLSDHTSGLMLVMHLETRGYGLALYASEVEALEACKATVASDDRPGQPLKLRIVEREKPPPAEAVYTKSITIEGREVPKKDLAVSKGLELAYRGLAIPRWCPRTLEELDCPLGTSCNKVHLQAWQRTVRKRPRVESVMQLSGEESHLVEELMLSRKAAMEAVLPSCASTSASAQAALEALPCAYVPVTLAEVEQCCGASSLSGADALTQKVARALDEAWPALCGNKSKATERNFFVRLSCPGGAPWDWALCDEQRGLPELRRRCPLPENGVPTPLDRDIYSQRIFYALNQLNCFTKATDAVRALTCSQRVKVSLAQFKRRASSMEEEEATASTREASRRKQGDGETGPATPQGLCVCIVPWRYLPTASCEVCVFLERGGRYVRGIAQRYGQLRLMTSATLLGEEKQQKEEKKESNVSSGGAAAAESMEDACQKVLCRFAVPGADADPAAERALIQEMGTFGKAFAAAAERLREKLRNNTALPAGAAWCARLAVVLPSFEESSSASAFHSPRVELVSFKSYQRALEECPMYTQLSSGSSNSQQPQQTATPAVLWNTQKHPFVPLFSRDVMERLRLDDVGREAR